MKKSLIIIGAGPGIGLAVAKRFGSEFKVGLISRSIENLNHLARELEQTNIETFTTTADAGNTDDLLQAVTSLRDQMGGIDLLVYNAAALRQKNILDETAKSLEEDFRVNVSNALTAVKVSLEDLKASSGAIILTGGGFSLYPSPEYGSVSIGKAGIRSLAFQLNTSLAEDKIFVGTVTIKGFVDETSETLNSTLIAEKFYELYQDRSAVEMQL